MSNDSLIIQRGGIPGPGSDVLGPLKEEAIQARNQAVEAADLVNSRIFEYPDDYLFQQADKEGRVLFRILKDFTFQTAGNVDSPGAGIGNRYRFYTFDGSNIGQEPLRIFEGVDGLTFPSQLPAVVNGLPSGCSIRDPDVFQDEAGTFWMVFSAFSFGTGPTAAQFGVARSIDGVTFTFVTLISIRDIPIPSGGTQAPDRAWAPQWVFDGAGGLYVLVSTYFGQIDTEGSGHERMVPVMMKITRPDMASMSYVGVLSGSRVPFNCIDGTIIRHNGVFLACLKNEATRELHIVWSNDLLTGYDNEGSTLTTSWGPPIEGPSFLYLGEGILRVYYDRYNGSGMFCRDSVDGGVTWGNEQQMVAAIERHGSVIKMKG